MGTAFGYPCVDNKHDVSILGTHLENKSIDELNKNRFHLGLNLEVSKSIKFLKCNSINDLFKVQPDLIVVGVNSKGIEWVAEELNKISQKGGRDQERGIICLLLLPSPPLTTYSKYF